MAAHLCTMLLKMVSEVPITWHISVVCNCGAGVPYGMLEERTWYKSAIPPFVATMDLGMMGIEIASILVG